MCTWEVRCLNHRYMVQRAPIVAAVDAQLENYKRLLQGRVQQLVFFTFTVASEFKITIIACRVLAKQQLLSVPDQIP